MAIDMSLRVGNRVIDAALRRFDRQLSQRGMNELEFNARGRRDPGHIDMSQLYNTNINSAQDASIVSTLLQCQTEKASYLCIHGPQNKLNNGREFMIGGTYNEKENPEFWFFGTTSSCHGGNYLLKIFVMTRTGDKFSLFLPSGHNLADNIEMNEKEKYCRMTGITQEYMFQHPNIDQVVFVKTYWFSRNDMELLGDYVLLLPCSIEMHTKVRIHPDLLKKVRLEYVVEANEGLYQRRHEGTFTLESASHKQYPVHLFVAAARSPLLMGAINNNHKSYFLDLNDEDVESIIEYLYTGAVKNVTADNAHKLLQLGEMMGFVGMKQLGASALSADINANNAVDLTILAKTYNLEELLLKAFHYIKLHPQILYCKSMECMNDVDLMRTMLKYVANPCSCVKKTN